MTWIKYQFHGDESPKKKVKFYLYCDGDGHLTESLFSDEGSFWDGEEGVEDTTIPKNWIKTNTFIEVEI